MMLLRSRSYPGAVGRDCDKLADPSDSDRDRGKGALLASTSSSARSRPRSLPFSPCHAFVSRKPPASSSSSSSSSSRATLLCQKITDEMYPTDPKENNAVDGVRAGTILLRAGEIREKRKKKPPLICEPWQPNSETVRYWPVALDSWPPSCVAFWRARRRLEM